ncbi:hypothetical protein ACWDUD_17240 [Rhodococcus sp. NPDC003382]
MTRSKESGSHGGSHTALARPLLVNPLKESTSLGGALQVVSQGALALAYGSLSAGRLVARRSADLAKTVLSRTRRTSPAGVVALASTDGTRTGRGRKALVVAGAVGAVVAGGVVFFRARRYEHPPVAPEPPRVDQARPVSEGTVSEGTD